MMVTIIMSVKMMMTMMTMMMIVMIILTIMVIKMIILIRNLTTKKELAVLPHPCKSQARILHVLTIPDMMMILIMM